MVYVNVIHTIHSFFHRLVADNFLSKSAVSTACRLIWNFSESIFADFAIYIKIVFIIHIQNRFPAEKMQERFHAPASRVFYSASPRMDFVA